MKQEILKTLKIVVLALVISVGVAYAANSWDAPSGTPDSSNNTPEPINKGGDEQTKLGGLGAKFFCLENTTQASSTKCIAEWPVASSTGVGTVNFTSPILKRCGLNYVSYKAKNGTYYAKEVSSNSCVLAPISENLCVFSGRINPTGYEYEIIGGYLTVENNFWVIKTYLVAPEVNDIYTPHQTSVVSAAKVVAHCYNITQ